jgi:hypothetical protein
MKNFKVTLTRAYEVSISARNEEEAKQFVEFFLNNCKNISTAKEHQKKKIKLGKIKPTINDATEIVEEICSNKNCT